MGDKCIQVPVVLGVGSTQHLICTEIPLKPNAFEIKDTKKKVEITSCCVGGLVKENGAICAKVIIDAVLKKNINFKSVSDCKPDDCDGLDTRVICGDLRHCHVRQRSVLNPLLSFDRPQEHLAVRPQVQHRPPRLALAKHVLQGLPWQIKPPALVNPGIPHPIERHLRLGRGLFLLPVGHSGRPLAVTAPAASSPGAG